MNHNAQIVGTTAGGTRQFFVPLNEAGMHNTNGGVVVNKAATTATLAAMLAIAAPMAYGQTTGAPMHATRSEATSSHIMPGQIRMTDMNGATVYDTQNQNLGDVKDVILDRDGRVAEVVLNVGSTLGMGGKYVAVSMRDLKVTMDKNNKPRFTVDMTKNQLKSAQQFDLNTTAENTGTTTEPASHSRSR